MQRTIARSVAAIILAASGMMASTVYSNTTTDTMDTIFYSVGSYSELGDQIHLAGTDRQTTSATVQFFNNGSTGTFDATLRFFLVGSPVGTRIGPSFMSGISAPASGVFNVTFSGLNTVVPTDVIFTVALSNATTASMSAWICSNLRPSDRAIPRS